MSVNLNITKIDYLDNLFFKIFILYINALYFTNFYYYFDRLKHNTYSSL